MHLRYSGKAQIICLPSEMMRNGTDHEWQTAARDSMRTRVRVLGPGMERLQFKVAVYRRCGDAFKGILCVCVSSVRRR